MIELQNKALRAEITGLKNELAATDEVLCLYIECYAKADDRLCSLKKEVEETRWEVLSWGQRYERVLVELVGVKKERRGARDSNEHAMIAAASDKLDRAIGKLEGAKL